MSELPKKQSHRFAFFFAVIVIAVVFFIFSYPALMLPKTLLIQYMIIIVIGVLLYFSFDEERWNGFMSPIKAVLRKPKLFPIRWLFLLAIPAIIAYAAYTLVKPSFEAP